jgi:glycosyltransferase involved in cell wall biosynthesis
LLICTGHFYPHVGGVERHALELWGRLAAKGWQVQLISANTHGAVEREWVRGIDVIRLPVFSLMHQRLPLPLLSGALSRAVLELSRAKPDVVVTNTRFFPATALGQLLARAWKRPTLHIEHGSGHIVVGSRLGDAVAKLVDRTVGAAVLKSATRCVGVSSSVVEFVRHLGRTDAGIIYNGVDTKSFVVDGTAERRALGVPDDATLILFVGRLFADKGVLDLVDAFQRLELGGRAQLVLAGDGPLAQQLRARTQGTSNVHLIGLVQPSRIPALLAASDIVAHPSACAEGLPTVVLEAAAGGCAIVASTVGGTPEIIEHEKSGLLVPPNDVTALARALQLMCADRPLRTRFGMAAQERSREVFDWERVVAVVEGELATLMRSPER